MIEKSILSDKLKSFEYYKKKLPLYLQNSYGFQEHFKIWHEILTNNIVDNADILLNLLMIFDDNYLTYLVENNAASQDGSSSDILDKLGSIFGVTRKFTVNYEEAGSPVVEELNLNNNDFLILIKAQIIKNYCEGTRKQIAEYYSSVGLQMFVQTDESSPATANLYLVESIPGTSYEYSENVEKMFLGGMLRIESVGIKYQEASIDVSRLLTWEDEEHLSQSYWAGNCYVDVNGTLRISSEIINPGESTEYTLYTVILTDSLNNTYAYYLDSLESGIVDGATVTQGTLLGSLTHGGEWII